MTATESPYRKFIHGKHGDLDPLKLATDFLLKSITKQKNKKGFFSLKQKSNKINSTEVQEVIEDISKRRAEVNQHPPYSSMVMEAIMALRERGGSSRDSVAQYLISKYDVGDDKKAVREKAATALR